MPTSSQSLLSKKLNLSNKLPIKSTPNNRHYACTGKILDNSKYLHTNFIFPYYPSTNYNPNPNKKFGQSVSYEITKIQYAEFTIAQVKNKSRQVGNKTRTGNKQKVPVKTFLKPNRNKLRSLQDEIYLRDFSKSNQLLHSDVDKNLGKVLAYNVFMISNDDMNNSSNIKSDTATISNGYGNSGGSTNQIDPNNPLDNSISRISSYSNNSKALLLKSLSSQAEQTVVIPSAKKDLNDKILPNNLISDSNEFLTMRSIKRNSVGSLDKQVIDDNNRLIFKNNTYHHLLRSNDTTTTTSANHNDHFEGIIIVEEPPSVKSSNNSSSVGGADLPSEDQSSRTLATLPPTSHLIVETSHNNLSASQQPSQVDVTESNLIKTDALNMSSMQFAMPKKDIWKCLIAELVGTALLIIIGCGSVVYTGEKKALDLSGIGLCWGLTVATLAQALGHVSGCHINPAVTLAMMVTGKIQVIKALLYVVVQCIGATVGTAILKALTPEDIIGNFGATELGGGVTAIQGFGIEFVSTFVLVLIIFGATDENRTDVKGSAPLAIGLCVGCLVMFGGPFTGASLNPARSLGPSIVAGRWEHHWLYWIGPIGGALVAATFYQQVLRALSATEIEAKQVEEDRQRDVVENSKEGSVPNV